MGKCVISTCSNRSDGNNPNGVFFHRIPKDNNLRTKWTIIIRILREERRWVPTKHTTICSAHFNPEDIRENVRRLKKGAIPIIKEDSFYDHSIKPERDEIEEPSWITIEEHHPAEIPLIKLENEEIEEQSWITFDEPHLSDNHSIKFGNNLIDDRDSIRIVEVMKTEKEDRTKESLVRMRRKFSTLWQKYNRLRRRHVKVLSIVKQNNILEKRASKLKKGKILCDLNDFPKSSFSPDLKKFATTLNHYSPVAYKYVRSKLDNRLPHPQTVIEWRGNVKVRF